MYSEITKLSSVRQEQRSKFDFLRGSRVVFQFRAWLRLPSSLRLPQISVLLNPQGSPCTELSRNRPSYSVMVTLWVSQMDHGAPIYLATRYFWVCLRGCSQMKLALLLVDLVNQFALPNVGGHHSIHGGFEWNWEAKEGRIWMLLPNGLSQDIDLPSSLAYRPRLDPMPSAPLLLRPLELGWIIALAFLCL